MILRNANRSIYKIICIIWEWKCHEHVLFTDLFKKTNFICKNVVFCSVCSVWMQWGGSEANFVHFLLVLGKCLWFLIYRSSHPWIKCIIRIFTNLLVQNLHFLLLSLRWTLFKILIDIKYIMGERQWQSMGKKW